MARTSALLKDRLATALSDAKKTGRIRNQSELAERVGIRRASISAWFTGDTKTLEGTNLAKAAEALGVDPHWLATGEHKVQEPGQSYGMEPILAWQHDEDLPPGDYIKIPRLEVTLAAGQGDEQRNLGLDMQLTFLKSETLAFRADWIRRMRLKPSKLASMKVSGDSMEERLYDGDAVVVDTSQIEVIDGRIYALWYDGGERVKRLYRLPGGGLMIRSDNEGKYPPITLSAEQAESVRVIGRVVHVSGEGGL
jgi:phage repressor protein C with HTH and peptisase S24 domain